MVDTDGERKEYTASKLTTPRTINGAPFDGTADINTKYAYNFTLDNVSSASYRVLASIGKTNGGNCTFVISGAANITTDYTSDKGCYLVYFSVRNNLISCHVTALSQPTARSSPRFYYWDDEDGYARFAIYRTPWSGTTGIMMIYNNLNRASLTPVPIDGIPEGAVEVTPRVLPAKGEINMATDIIGILPVENGGTGNADGVAPGNMALTGGSVTGLIENYGGIGIRKTPCPEGNHYIEIATVNSTVGFSNAQATMIISCAGRYTSQTCGIWFVEIGVRSGVLDAAIDCLHKNKDGNVIFWSYLDSDGLYHFGLTSSGFSAGPVITPLQTKALSAVTFSKSDWVTGNPPTGWNEIPIRNLLGSDGGAVNGLIENYGGIGIKTTYKSNLQYVTFAKISLSNGGTISCLISNLTAWNGNRGSTYLINAGFVAGNDSPSIDVTRLSSSAQSQSHNIHFGWFLEDSKINLVVSIPEYAPEAQITPISNRACECGVLNSSTTEPTGWTEIPVRVLQDAEQVAEATVAKANSLSIKSMDNTDLDTLKTQGIYRGYTGMTHAVAQSIGVLEVIPYNNDWILQRHTYINSNTLKPSIYERMFYMGTTWGPWYKTYTEAHPQPASTSARRYKENLSDITANESKKLLNINPQHFDFIDGKKNQSGFIAEDIEPIYPEICWYNEEDKLEGLNYSNFTPYIVKLLQVQQEEIDILKKKINALEQKI